MLNTFQADKKDDVVKNLSGGQKRKLSVGVALIGDPKIIFLGWVHLSSLADLCSDFRQDFTKLEHIFN